MKIIAAIIVIVLAILFWQLDSLVSWLVVGLILGLIAGWYTSEEYIEEYSRTQEELLKSHIKLDAIHVIGEKTSNIGGIIVTGLLFGVILYAIDGFLSWLF